MNKSLIKIASQLIASTSFVDITPFGNGHINNTYQISDESGKSWLLQKINKHVFTNPTVILRNHIELIRNYDFKNEIEIPILINEQSESYFFKDNEDEYWRVLNFFDNTQSIENITSENQAIEAGKAYGSFLKGCTHCDIKSFEEPIPQFHSITNRFHQFNQAIKQDKAKRLNSVREIVSFYSKYHSGLQHIEHSIAQEVIPTRIVHNDTKINNLLFREDKTVAVVDLDTTGPGTILFDYGDAIRTLANETFEDDVNLHNVSFSVKWFSAFTKGYLQQALTIMKQKEKQMLWQAPFLMTFIMGIRFLTDYINGDIYYKTQYENHNLVRSKVQKALLEDMTRKKDKIIQAIDYQINNL